MFCDPANLSLLLEYLFIFCYCWLHSSGPGLVCLRVSIDASRGVPLVLPWSLRGCPYSKDNSVSLGVVSVHGQISWLSSLIVSGAVVKAPAGWRRPDKRRRRLEPVETDLGQGWAGIGGSCCYSQGNRTSFQTFTAFLSRGHCRAKRYQHVRLVSHGRFLRSMGTEYGYLSHLDPWQVVGPFHQLSSSRWSYQLEDK